MAKTLREKYIAGLLAFGCRPDPRARALRYETFLPPRNSTAGRKGYKYFVGRTALRVGRTVATSRPVSDAGKAAIISRGENAILEAF